MKQAQEENQSPCIICMQRPSNTNISSCDHKFCGRCIGRWSKVCYTETQKNNSCPVCRKRFRTIIGKRHRKDVQDVGGRRVVRSSSSTQSTTTSSIYIAIPAPMFMYMVFSQYLYLMNMNQQMQY